MSTPMRLWSRISPQEPRSWWSTIWTPLIPASFDAEHVAEFGQQTPMKRAGQPNEVAPCYVFLACEDASYMTGQVLHPNGGHHPQFVGRSGLNRML